MGYEAQDARRHPEAASRLTADSRSPGGERLVVRGDVAVGAVEEVLVLLEFVFEEGAAGGLLDFTFAGGGLLPAGEADDGAGGV